MAMVKGSFGLAQTINILNNKQFNKWISNIRYFNVLNTPKTFTLFFWVRILPNTFNYRRPNYFLHASIRLSVLLLAPPPPPPIMVLDPQTPPRIHPNSNNSRPALPPPLTHSFRHCTDCRRSAAPDRIHKGAFCYCVPMGCL